MPVVAFRNNTLPMNFADLGLSEELLQAVSAAGYDSPTPIQAQAIPSVLMMRDLIGIAQTCTGKCRNGEQTERAGADDRQRST